MQIEPAGYFRVFWESDGCKADFLKGFFLQYGRHFDETHIGVAWKFIRSRPNFYRDVPLMPDAEWIWEEVKQYKPAILTGAPSGGFEDAKTAKIAFYREVHQHIYQPAPKIIVCLSKDKPLHMVNKGDILVDDHEKNGKAWMAAGGDFVKFDNARQAVSDLHALVAKKIAAGYVLQGHDDE
jgi:hypothetical protein